MSTEIWECDICGRTKSSSGNLFTLDTVTQHIIDAHGTPKIEEDPVDERVPQKGLWYELIDFSERDYGSSWGFYGYKDGVKIYNSGGLWSKIRWAGDAAREWKKEKMRE